MLLVIGIAIGGLASYGVFNTFFAPEACTITPGLSCDDFKFEVGQTTQNVHLKLSNGMGEDLEDFTIKVKLDGVSCGETAESNTFSEGNTQLFVIPCSIPESMEGGGSVEPGEKAIVDFEITYIYRGKTINHTVQGQMVVKVEAPPTILGANDTNITQPPINDTNITQPPINDTKKTNVPINNTNTTVPPPNSSNLTIGGCTDFDGGKNYYIKSYAEVPGTYGPSKTYDVCLGTYSYETMDKPEVSEVYCDQTGQVKRETYTCPNGCREGACKANWQNVPCIDTDGGQNANIKGTTSDSLVTLTDSCVYNQPNKLSEYYCDQWGANKKSVDCPDGCSDGACNDQVSGTNSDAYVTRLDYSPSSYSITLKDPDGMKSIAVKTVSGNWLWGGSPPCSKSLISGTVTAADSEFPLSWSIGDCVGDNQGGFISLPPPGVDCTDSDGGEKFYVQGTTWDSYSGVDRIDYCSDNSLVEYYCLEGFRKLVLIPCLENCVSGACTKIQCAGPGLRADIYGGPNKICCEGLTLQGGLCNNLR